MRITLTFDEYAAANHEMNGFCLACGAESMGPCEPDARNYPCEECGKNKVFGAEECMMMGVIDFVDDE